MKPEEPGKEDDTQGRPSQKIEFIFNPAGAEETQSALVSPSSIPATPTVSEGEGAHHQPCSPQRLRRSLTRWQATAS